MSDTLRSSFAAVAADLFYLDLAVQDSRYRYIISPKFIAMAPKRTVRRGGETPSPAPRPSPGPRASPARVLSGRVADTGRAAGVRTAMPTKYSTSYGSPMSQLPNRAVVHGAVDLAQATKEVLKTVQKDQRAALEARQKAEQQKKSVSGRSTRTSTTRGSRKDSDEEPEESEEEENQESEDEYIEDEEDEEQGGGRPDRTPSKKPPAQKKPETEKPKTSTKRPRDDDEGERQAEQERREREVRLQRERAEEAHRVAAAKEKAEQERRAQETARQKVEKERQDAEAARQKAERERRKEEVAKAAEAHRLREARLRQASMPPPAAPPITPAGRGSSLPPSSSLAGTGLPRIPGSARSFVEESDVYGDARLRTPKPPSPTTARRSSAVPKAKPKAPPRSPQSASSSSSDPLTSDVEIRPRPGATKPAKPAKPAVSRPPAPPAPPAPPRRPSIQQVQDALRAKTQQPQSIDVARWVNKLKSSRILWSILNFLKFFVLAMALVYGYRFFYLRAKPDLFESPVMSLHWYGWGNWKSNVGQFFPSPVLHPLGVLSDNQYDNLKEFMQNESSSTAAAVKRLEEILPRMVHVKKDKGSGKLIVDDEFWRALSDKIRDEESILTLLDGNADISDKHWKAVQARLKKSGDVEEITQKTFSNSWEKWLKDNQRKVAEILGKNLPSAPGTQDTVMTKEDFAKELEPIFEENKLTSAKIQKLEKLVNQALGRSQSSAEGGIAEAKVREIVNKAIKAAKLEAGARGEISRFDAELERQVNHFGIGNGATVEEDDSSPTWGITKHPLGSKEWRKVLSTAPRFLSERFAALSSWDEAGHCWCAGTQINATHSRPADIFVHLTNFIIPQHVVIEHINPDATIDPEAMPKDIEVWAQFDEYQRQEMVQKFMQDTFPDSRERNPDLLAKGFLQIAKFRYEHRAQDRGIKIERLSRELEALKAATDFILVRATTNHGAPDHTCFYRIRMYGEVAELPVAEQESRTWGS